ncbi:MAG: MerR family DNA-binding protein, partial [Pseudomonadota bacterium]
QRMLFLLIWSLLSRRWGFSLEELRQWLLVYENEGSEKQTELFIEYAERQLIELRKKRVELDEVIGELEGLKDSLKRDLSSA